MQCAKTGRCLRCLPCFRCFVWLWAMIEHGILRFYPKWTCKHPSVHKWTVTRTPSPASSWESEHHDEKVGQKWPLPTLHLSTHTCCIQCRYYVYIYTYTIHIIFKLCMYMYSLQITYAIYNVYLYIFIYSLHMFLTIQYWVLVCLTRRPKPPNDW